MKKLIFLLLFGIMSFYMANAQEIFKYDSIPLPSGADTTVYIPLFTRTNWSIEFDYSALDDVDATLDLGGASEKDGTSFVRLDDDRLPFTLSGSTVGFEKGYFSFRYLAIKLTKVSCTAGTTDYVLTK